ncbi:MAG: hypothetical protein U1C46_08950 [Bacteroidales bacterium]|nr:hypothetical protein [Bacteroidales bacterium]MDZ4204931.1 hypothetical protein [Bacteroidales bacterium]
MQKLFVKYTLLIIMLLYAVLFLLIKHPGDPYDRIIASDGKGYYAYLPALFIYHDLDYGFVEQYESTYYPSDETPSYFKEFRFRYKGEIVNKTFAGIAVLMLPFFLLAHLLALLLGQADGYSMAYQYAIGFSSYFYLWLGLLALRRLLSYFSNQKPMQIALVLFAVALGTNLVYYTVVEGTMPHVYNFFLITSFLLLIYRALHERNKVFYLGAALIFGLILITRPQNGFVILLLPFLAGDWKVFKQAIIRFVSDLRLLSGTVLICFAVVFLQIVLWYLQTGHFLVYSYGDETFNFLNPQMVELLWSYEKGWMVYTPLSFLAIAGLIVLIRNNRWKAFWVIIFFVTITYVLSCWWVWHYTSQFGQRVFIDFYAVLGILLLLGFSLLKSKLWQGIHRVLILALIALNVFQFAQHLKGVYPAGAVNRESFWKNFLSTSSKAQVFVPRDMVIQTYQTNQTYDEINNLIPAERILDLPAEFQFDETKPLHLMRFEYGALVGQKRALLRTNLEITAQNRMGEASLLLEFFTGGMKYSEYNYAFSRYLRIHRKVKISPVIYLPLVYHHSDSVRVSIIAKGNPKVRIQNIGAEIIIVKPEELPRWIPRPLNSVQSSITYKSGIETEHPKFIFHAFSDDMAFEGNKSAMLNPDYFFNVEFNEGTTHLFSTNNTVLRLTTQIYPEAPIPDALFVISLHNGSKTYFYHARRLADLIIGQWNEVTVLNLLPVFESNSDTFKCYFWDQKPGANWFVDAVNLEFISLTDRHFIPVARSNVATFNGQLLTSIPLEIIMNSENPFHGPPWYDLYSINSCNAGKLRITAQAKTNAWFPFSNLVVSHYNADTLVSYQVHYLTAYTRPGRWVDLFLDYDLPKCVGSSDILRIYFWNSGISEELGVKNIKIFVTNDPD